MNRADRRRQERAKPLHPVVFAYVHPGQLSAAFSFSKLRLFMYETGRVGLPPQLLALRCSSGQLVESRNEMVKTFLDTMTCEWLFCVDSDMGFDGDTLARLLAVADKNERPVVGALCFGVKKLTEDFALQSVDLRCFPTIYRWVETEDEAGFKVVTQYPRDSLVECSATGAACFVAHRSVLEAIRAKFGDRWFDKATHERTQTTFSEDLSFFIRCAAVDVPVFVDTNVKTSHDKGGIFWTEQRWDEQEIIRRAQEAQQSDDGTLSPSPMVPERRPA